MSLSTKALSIRLAESLGMGTRFLFVCETCRDNGTYTVAGITAISAQIAPCDGCKRMDGETVTRVTKST